MIFYLGVSADWMMVVVAQWWSKIWVLGRGGKGGKANLNVCVHVEGGWCSYVSFEISLSTTSPILLDEKKKCHQPLPPSMSATTISSHGSLATSIQLSDICNLYTPIWNMLSIPRQHHNFSMYKAPDPSSLMA